MVSRGKGKESPGIATFVLGGKRNEMLFKEVIGQQEVKQNLLQSVHAGRVPHAQLYHGREGVGKLPMAIAYARFLHCTDRKEDDACGVCPACIKMGKLVHPDHHFIFPIINKKEKSSNTTSDDYLEQWREAILENPYLTENGWYEKIGAENKQGVIGKAESNELLRKMGMKSYESEFKTVIIWMAEKMNLTASNKLLKLIEEPPDNTVFLLITDDTEAILPTIRSRTQLLALAPLKQEDIRAGLAKQFDGHPSIPDVIRKANGNYSAAVARMISEEQEQEYFEEFVYLMRRSYERDIISLNKWVEKASRLGRERIKQFLTYSLGMVRDNFMLNLEQKEYTYLSQQEQEFSTKFAPFIHRGNVERMAIEFDRAISHIEANGYARLVLLDLSIKIILLIKQPAPAA